MREINQVVLPLNIGYKIPDNDPVVLLSELCDELDYTKICKKYLRTWRKHSPKTLFKSDMDFFTSKNRAFSWSSPTYMAFHFLLTAYFGAASFPTLTCLVLEQRTFVLFIVNLQRTNQSLQIIVCFVYHHFYK